MSLRCCGDPCGTARLLRQFAGARLAVVADHRASRRISLLCHRGDHRIRRLMECEHRCRRCLLGRPAAGGLRSWRLHCAATAAGDFHRIVLGIAMMSLFVVVINRTLWRPLYNTPNANSGWNEPLNENRSDMAVTARMLEVQSVRQAFSEVRTAVSSSCLTVSDLDTRRRRDRGTAWAFGLGQIDAAAAHRGPCPAERRQHHAISGSRSLSPLLASRWCFRTSRFFLG